MDNNIIQWIPSKRERKLKNCHAITFGVECSRCKCFQEYESRFCKDCGGKYDGILPKFNKYSERKLKEINRWHT